MNEPITPESILLDYAEESLSENPRFHWQEKIKGCLVGPHVWLKEIEYRRGEVRPLRIVIQWEWGHQKPIEESWHKLCQYLQCSSGGHQQENSNGSSGGSISTVTIERREIKPYVGFKRVTP